MDEEKLRAHLDETALQLALRAADSRVRLVVTQIRGYDRKRELGLLVS
jgi:hypothetical protein